ncbi:MAG: hypothetical protein ACI9UJ_002091, partial [bacterium]
GLNLLFLIFSSVKCKTIFLLFNSTISGGAYKAS